jgi:RAB protein geranylgeranyltransferase component A
MEDHSTMIKSTDSHSESSSQKEAARQSAVLPNNDDVDGKTNETNPIHQDEDASAPDNPLEPKELDEEGLALEYDVVICGTGLVQSILASALARAGKSVLHCDGADYYGELDAVWSLPMIEELLERKIKEFDTSENNNEACKDHVESPGNIPLAPDGGCTSLRWHHSYCSSSSPSNSGKYNFGIRVGTHVKTPFSDGIVRSIRHPSHENCDHENSSASPSSISLEIELNKWKLADGRSPTAYINLDDTELLNEMKITSIDHKDEECDFDPILLEDILCRSKNIRSTKSVQAETILKKSARSLALDASPSFVLAAGRAVQGMLASGVADYLEFKTVDALYWLEKTKPTSNKKRSKKINTSMNGSNEKNDDDVLVLSRVPCSKNDVFGTKLLAPMEKRRFMKFIQLSMDYATKIAVAEETRQEDGDGGNHGEESQMESEEEVHSLNERHLNQGRSLARPQNKAVNTDELQILQELIENESMTFDDFLSQKYKLSPKLRSIVRYALAWEIDDSSTTLAEGMTTLRKHLQALGRYGTTAFLVPLYGSGELSQAFSRSAAVFGATYLLRRAPLAVQVENDDTEACCETKGSHNQRVRGIVLSNDMLVDGFSKDASQQEAKPKTKVIKCSQVVVPINAMVAKSGQMANSLRRRIIRRISVFSGTIIQSDSEEQRHVIFIPPRTTGNDHAIHGVLLDSSVRIAPRGCTILHLTTTIVEESIGDKNSEGKNPAEILEHAQAAFLKSKATQNTDDPPIELYHVSFSHECPDLESARTACHPIGFHLCSHTAQVLTADAAFEQAEEMFSSICPGEEFLGLSGKIDKVIRERAEEKKYDDEEKNVLESALGMIEQTPGNPLT